MLSRNHLSYQLPSIGKWSEKSKTKFDEAVIYLQRLRRLISRFRLPSYKIAAMDKTKFYLESHRVSHISMRGGYVTDRVWNGVE
jgi:hypothetical protein